METLEERMRAELDKLKEWKTKIGKKAYNSLSCKNTISKGERLTSPSIGFDPEAAAKLKKICATKCHSFIGRDLGISLKSNCAVKDELLEKGTIDPSKVI